MRCRSSVLLASVLVCVGCGSLPRDPEGTSERVTRQRQVRVGLTDHPPWVIRTKSEPAGAEVELIREFAASERVVPTWTWGSETQLMHALKRFELDLVIGGLLVPSPWNAEVGLTTPYYKKYVMAVPPGENGWLKRLEE